MRARVLVGGLLFAAVVAVEPAAGQVAGTVVLQHGPVRGAVVIGDVWPARPVVVAPPVVVFDRWHGPPGRAVGWWRQAGFVPVTVWTDGHAFYPRQWRPIGLRPVQVFHRGGRYYRWDEIDRRFDRQLERAYREGYRDGRRDDRRFDRRSDDRRWDGERRGGRDDDGGRGRGR